MVQPSESVFSAVIFDHKEYEYINYDNPESPFIVKCDCGEKLGESDRSSAHLDMDWERISKAHADHIASVLWKLVEGSRSEETGFRYSDGTVATSTHEVDEATKRLPWNLVYRYVTEWENVSDVTLTTVFPDDEREV